MGALAPANFETRANSTRNFGTIYYCQHSLAPVNGTSYYCQYPQFKIPKYTPIKHSLYIRIKLICKISKPKLNLAVPYEFLRFLTHKTGQKRFNNLQRSCYRGKEIFD